MIYNSKFKIQNSKLQKSSRIFVAGGTGLVGSAIIKNLLKKGYPNIISTFRRRKPDKSLPVKWVKVDLLSQFEVKEFFENEKPEFVFMAAAIVGGIVANNTYRADFIYENLQVQNNVIHNSYLHGVKKLMFLGSTCIYPKNCPQPMKEEHLLTSPLEYTNEPYAIAKIAGIKMCESYNLQYGTNFISVMPTNLYGPNDNFDLEKSHVLPALIRKIHLGKCLENNDWDAIKKDLNKLPIEGIDGTATNEQIINILNKYGISLIPHNSSLIPNFNKVEIEIWGSGKPTREFLWSEDMSDACVYLMENINFKDIVSTNSSLISHSSSLHEVKNTHINIGSGEQITIKDLACLIKNIVGYNGDLYFNKNKPDGTMKKLSDVSKLNILGWKHQISLKKGIEKLYNWYVK